MNKILYLINPQSDEKRALSHWKKACKKEKRLPKEAINILSIPNLATFLAHEKPDIIAVAGGDGTINNVCSATLHLTKKPKIAILPMGFGNGLSYALGVDTMKKACDVLYHPPCSVDTDVFKTTIPELPYCYMNMGIGFDGKIVHGRMNYRYIGIRSYVIAAIQSYLFHVKKRLTITIDHTVTLTSSASSLIITNSPVVGKFLTISEDAKLNDGFLNCILFASKYAYFTNIRLRGFRHPLYSPNNKVYFKAKHVKIEGEYYTQVDGDPIIMRKPVEVEVAQEKITFLCNTKEYIELDTSPFV